MIPKTKRNPAFRRTVLPALLIIGMLRPAPAEDRIGQEAFYLGANYPWAAYGHDFGSNGWGHDGIATGGWTYQTFEDSQGFTDVRPCDDGSGGKALCIAADLLRIQDEDQMNPRAQGEAWIDLTNHPYQATTPLDIRGGTFDWRMRLPKGSCGSESARQTPNGVQIFFKNPKLYNGDTPSFYSRWINIDCELEENWTRFESSLSEPEAVVDESFDPTQVTALGIKVGISPSIPEGSEERLSGQILVDDLVLHTKKTVRFDFERLETESDFEQIQKTFRSSESRTVVRIFVFANGAASPEFNPQGMVMGLEETFFDDFKTILELAHENEILLMPVLLDFLWCYHEKEEDGVYFQGHSNIIRDPVARESFLNNALIPFVDKYNNDPNIFAIDIINEPEWVIRELGGDPDKGELVSLEEMREFVRLCTEAIHAHSSFKVTVGSARLQWLQHWKGLELDLYQAHWYDHFEPQESFPWTPCDDLDLDQPCIIGEVPTSKTQYSPTQFISAARDGGYQGLLIWSQRASDCSTDFRCAQSTIQGRHDSSLYFPLYLENENTFTGFAVTNGSERVANLELFAYGSDGQLMPLPNNPAQLQLQSGHQIALLGHEIFDPNREAPQTPRSGWVEMRTDNLEIGSFFQFGSGETLDGAIAITGQSKKLYFTRIFEGEAAFRGLPAQTFLAIANPNQTPIALDIKLHGSIGVDGRDPESTRNPRTLQETQLNLDGKGFIYHSVSDIFQLSDPSISPGFVEVEVVEGEGAIGFELMRLADRVIGLNTSFCGRSFQLSSAQLALGPDIFTNLNLINVGDEERILHVSAIANDGSRLAEAIHLVIKPGEVLHRDVDRLWQLSGALSSPSSQNPRATSAVGSLLIEANGANLVGDVIFGGNPLSGYAAALPLGEPKFTTALFSQIASTNNFFTGLAIFSPGADSEILIEAFSPEGTKFGDKTLVLEKGQRLSQTIDQLLLSNDEIEGGYIRISSSRPVVAQQLFGARDLSRMSAVPPMIIQ